MNQNLPGLPDQQSLNSSGAMAELQRRVRNGSSNFYWIAGLSVVNTLLSLFNTSVTFPIGLAVTQIIDGVVVGVGKSAGSQAATLWILGLLIDVGIAGLFVLFGLLAVRGASWAYTTGVILYGLDALLMLLFADYIGLLFHLFFLWLLFNGLQAARRLNRLNPPSDTNPPFPKNIGMP
jgi:zinc transporter ZupT